MANTSKRFYYKQNRLKQLRAFCFAAQESSISRAAERMFLSQPSVSLQVRALEDEMGATLFERRGPRIELTPQGQVLYELASPMVDAMDNLPAAFAERCGNLDVGELDIAAGESTLLYILPRYARLFSDRHPGIDIRLHNVTGKDGLAALRADKVDFAVGPMPDFPDDIAYEPIFSFDTVLIAPHGHPLLALESVSLRDISPYGLILPPRHLSTWGVVDLVFRQHDVPYTVSLEAGGYEVIKRYVEQGMGVSIVSGLCLTGDDRVGAVSLQKYFPTRTYGVVTRRGRFLSPAARRFIETLQESAGDLTGAASS